MKENSIEEETISSNHESPIKKVLDSENIFNNLVQKEKEEKNNEKSNKLSKSYNINISKDNSINKENEDIKYNFGIFPDKKDSDSPENKIKEKEISSPNEFKEFKFTLLKMIDDEPKNNSQNKSSLNNNYDLINNSFINNEKESNSNFYLNNIFLNKDSNTLIPNLDSSLNEEMNNLNLDNNQFYNKNIISPIIFNNPNDNSKNKFEPKKMINDNENSNSLPLFQFNNDFNIINNNNFNFNNFPNPSNNFYFNDYSNIYNNENMNNLFTKPNQIPIHFYNNFNNNNKINSNNYFCQNNFININNNEINEFNLQNFSFNDNIKSSNLSNNQINQLKKKTKPPLKLNLTQLSIEDLIKNSIILSKDQNGCRLLQKKIDEQPEIAKDILNNILETIIEIITDPFGNYLIQKLYNYMNEEQFLKLMALFQFDINFICCNSYGTRAIQKLIDYLTSETLMKTFVNLIKNDVKNIINDINGSHILLKVFSLNNLYANSIIFNEIFINILSIATHKHGCCVLQKCIEKINLNDKNKLINCIIDNCKVLICDQCGNYIIQFIIAFKIDFINEKIVSVLIEKLEEYSIQKFSSNVVEKILEICSYEICEKIINILKNDEHIILSILFNKFGNYVLQKALQRADKETQQLILEIIAPHLSNLKNYSFGMKLYSKLIINYNYLGNVILTKNEEQNNKKKK